MMPPFLTWSLSIASAAVVPGGADLLQADLLQHLADRIADGRGGCQRQVDDAERDAEPARRLLRHKLADARDLERGALDRLAQELEVAALGLVERAGRPHRGRRRRR